MYNTRRLLETLNVSIVLTMQLIAAGTALVPAQLDTAAVLLLPLLLALRAHQANTRRLLEMMPVPPVYYMLLVAPAVVQAHARLDMAEVLLLPLRLAMHAHLAHPTRQPMKIVTVSHAKPVRLVVARRVLVRAQLDMAEALSVSLLLALLVSLLQLHPPTRRLL